MATRWLCIGVLAALASFGSAKEAAACRPLERCLVEGPQLAGPGQWEIVYAREGMGLANDLERCMTERHLVRFAPTGSGGIGRLTVAIDGRTSCDLDWRAESPVQIAVTAANGFTRAQPEHVEVGALFYDDLTSGACSERLRGRRPLDLQFTFTIPAESAGASKPVRILRCLAWIGDTS